MEVKNRKSYRLLWFLSFIGILDSIVVIAIEKQINFGTVLPGIAGIMLAICILTNFFGGIRKKLAIPWAIKLAAFIAVGLVAASFFIVQVMILANSMADTDAKADYMVVLGTGLDKDKPTSALYERLAAASQHLKDNHHIRVVVSGGQGPGETISEAEAMKRFLVEAGIDEKRIIKEARSTSTWENLLFSKELIQQEYNGKGEIPIIIVTNRFHIYRAKIIANRLGYTAYGLPAKTPALILMNCYLREYFALVKSLLLDK